MTSEREQRRARMTAAATRKVQADPPLTGPTEIVRVKPVRITVDLAPDLYKTLTRWTKKTALLLDLDRLPAAEVVRACIRTLDITEGEVQKELQRNAVGAVVTVSNTPGTDTQQVIAKDLDKKIMAIPEQQCRAALLMLLDRHSGAVAEVLKRIES